MTQDGLKRVSLWAYQAKRDRSFGGERKNSTDQEQSNSSSFKLFKEYNMAFRNCLRWLKLKVIYTMPIVAI